jgi:hypothetical protein
MGPLRTRSTKKAGRRKSVFRAPLPRWHSPFCNRHVLFLMALLVAFIATASVCDNDASRRADHQIAFELAIF